MPAFCEEDDVREALQEQSLSGPTGSSIVQSAIRGVSTWFANATNGYWFDSGTPTLIPTSNTSASDVQLDVPSSPHAQDRQQISHRRGARYPVTVAGPYAEIPLPHIHITNLTKLEVRESGGGVTDWVADSSKTEGRGDDFYLQTRGQDSYGRTYLYIHGRAIGARTNFRSLLTLAYDYGLDWQTTEWHDVRRGIAALSAAQVVDEDDVLTQIPDQGQLIGVQTEVQNLIDEAMRYLEPYL